jgi:hypothetical protein
MRRGLAVHCVVVSAAVALSGCGRSSSSQSSQAPSSSGSTASNGEVHKSATQVLADAAAALGQVHSFHLQGRGVDLRGVPERVDGDIQLPGRVLVHFYSGSQQVSLIAFYGTTYISANPAFWAAQHLPARAMHLLANRWIVVRHGAPGVARFLSWADPATIGHCMIERHVGTVAVAGTSTYGGRPVVILRDLGDRPGSTPGELYVSASGPPLAVRAIQTGPSRAGGTPDRTCGEAPGQTDTTKSSDITISGYDQPVNIAAPSNAYNFTGGA